MFKRLKAINFGDVIKRFPVVTLILAAFAVMIMIGDFRGDDIRLRITLSLALAAYLGVIITLIGEANGKGPRYILQFIIAALAVALGWAAKALNINVWVLVVASTFLLGNAYLWRQARDDDRTWNFTHLIWSGAVFAAVGSILYALGVLFIDEALSQLFGLDIDDLIEHVLLPVGLGFLAPLFWLSTVPKADEPADELLQNPSFVSRAIGFMGSYILAPLTLIYALILLAYGVKIALAGELPKGEIAGLTTPFLIIGTLTWLLLHPPFIAQKWISRIYRRIWFFAMIPAALLLLVSVWERVSQYGWTEERVYLALAVAWGLATALWFAFAPKARRDIRIIPRLAAIALILGGLFATSLSYWNQTARVEDGLRQAGLLTPEGVLKPTDQLTITDEAAAVKAKGAILYLLREDKARLQRFIPENETFAFPAARYYNSEERRKVLARFGVDGVQLSQEKGDKYRWQRIYNDDLNAQVLSSEASDVFIVTLSASKSRPSAISFGDYKVEIIGDRLNLVEKDQPVSSTDLGPIAVALGDNDDMDARRISLGGTQNADYSFIIQRMNFRHDNFDKNPSDDQISSISGLLIVSKKPKPTP